jgi:3-hydroxyisobutyrate dehydrogenase
LKTGAVFIDHTTASARIARELHAAAKARGAAFLDAPVSGGQSGAESGTLTVMVGGDEADFGKAEPVIAAYARAVTLIGPSGSGQLTKMVNQICIAG